MNIKIYGADWCSDCVNAKNFFHSKGLEFEYIVITKNNSAIAFLEKVNEGKRTIPVIVINGKTYVNPGIKQLIKIITE